jgi:uncharacterized membrane protein (UPF0127 family)
VGSDGEGRVFVFNKTKQTFLAYRVEVADSILKRLVGLLGRRSLDLDCGLWIIPSRGIHTVGMLFDIDVVFLNKQLRVVGLRELVRPYSISPLVFAADSVLELPSHTIFRSGTEIGDELVISSIESTLSEEEDLSAEPPKVDVA